MQEQLVKVQERFELQEQFELKAEAKESHVDLIKKKLFDNIRQVDIKVTQDVWSCLRIQQQLLGAAEWDTIGNWIMEKERDSCDAPDNKFVTLRLDGCCFRTKVKALRRNACIEKEGMSKAFAEIMVLVARTLHKEYQALYTHCHSDEITMVLTPPSQAVQKPEYIYRGRHDKLVSTAAGLASAVFTHEITRRIVSGCDKSRPILAKHKDPDCDKDEDKDQADLLKKCLHVFDCRMGVWDTLPDALTLLLWRSRDAIMNGISDTVRQSGVSGCHQMANCSLTEKIKWIQLHNVNSVVERIYGTTFYKGLVERYGRNKLTDKPVVVKRNCILSSCDNLVVWLLKTVPLV